MSDRATMETIANLVPQGSRVLDLGCGDGALLDYLQRERGCSGYGIEIADANVLACVKRGVNVIQLNLDEGLSMFDDDSFDVVLADAAALNELRVTEKNALADAVGRQAGEARMLAHGRFVRREIDAVDLVGGHEALDPLDLGAELREDAAGVLRGVFQVAGGEISDAGHFTFDDELGHVVLAFFLVLVSRPGRCADRREYAVQ